jgi:hypothetical protein
MTYEYMKEWYARHPYALAKAREQQKQYQKDHMDKHNSYNRDYYFRTIEKQHSRRKAYRVKNKQNWLILLKELGWTTCSNCGYDKCFAAIDFHHRNPDEKEINIGNMFECPITEKRLNELKKCTPLCSNCHRELENS